MSNHNRNSTDNNTNLLPSIRQLSLSSTTRHSAYATATTPTTRTPSTGGASSTVQRMINRGPFVATPLPTRIAYNRDGTPTAEGTRHINAGANSISDRWNAIYTSTDGLSSTDPADGATAASLIEEALAWQKAHPTARFGPAFDEFLRIKRQTEAIKGRRLAQPAQQQRVWGGSSSFGSEGRT